MWQTDRQTNRHCARWYSKYRGTDIARDPNMTVTSSCEKKNKQPIILDLFVLIHIYLLLLTYLPNTLLQSTAADALELATDRLTCRAVATAARLRAQWWWWWWQRLLMHKKSLDTFPRNFSVDGEVASLLRTCQRYDQQVRNKSL